MLHSLRTHARSLSAFAAAGLVALWVGSFASACLAAASACDMPGSDCAKNDLALVATPCQQAMAPCEMPAVDTPISGIFTFAPLPAVTALDTFGFALALTPALPPSDWAATRPPPAPLYLAFLALLN